MAAIIDIGSNSVRLLINGEKTTVTTRLSEDLARTGLLNEAAMSRTLETLCGFSAQARASGEPVHAFGTEPLRAARNADDFIRRVKREAGFDIKVLSGSEEAELAYLGAACDGGGAVIDIGGASVEIVCGGDGAITYEKSLPTGIIRLTENSGGDADKMRQLIAENLPLYGQVPIESRLFGVGGTFTSLAAMMRGLNTYDSRIVHGTRLTRAAVKIIADTLIPLRGNVGEIMRIYPVIGSARAEIITAGAIFAYMLLDYLGAEEITVSESDNLEGYQIKYLY